ncbi:glycerophosphodiester phosphodiesterase [Streptomyces litchfieldiae]|uniref:Glycerophosphodiester phosphodiesterase family protein n=1 Tax=Streptomyces litchfieldiae TaxID=3075543 RepID=A0ABU2MTT8_9ACTN|nr:glycerophosphodiester phosphodiesterase family protein [Streptomyces sp. DSM 44938]MDT0344728.1 glycerophosphodiester phosphodiesterase family protein [Streptomyces sp. DSM 44938]
MPFPSAVDWAGRLFSLAVLVSVPATGPAASLEPAAPREPVPAVVAAPAPAVAAPAARPAPHRDEPLVVAHRGASGYAPENTLAAADAADALGTTWVETDVQRTADGELVLMHDTTLERTTNAEVLFPDRAPWRVADFTAAEMARLDAGSWFGEEFAGEPVPTLTDFADRLADNGQRLLLEIKSPASYPGIEADILDELRAAGWLGERHPGRRLVIQSFDAASVRRVHELAPRVETGFLGTPAVADVPEYAEFADQINPRYRDLTADYVADLQAVEGPHGEPVEVYAWTVNDGPTAVAVAELGVDGIITNFPDVVRDALEE